MLDTSGFIAETNATHLFFVAAGTVQTPRLKACPEGVTRAAVLQLCETLSIPCRVDDLTLTEAYRADESFCSGTMGELAAITEIDGRRIGSGSPGPLTERLSSAFQELARREAEPI